MSFLSFDDSKKLLFWITIFIREAFIHNINSGSVKQANELASRDLAEIIREILENRARAYRQLGEEYDATRDRRPTSEEDLAEEQEEREGAIDANFINYESPVIENHHTI